MQLLLNESETSSGIAYSQAMSAVDVAQAKVVAIASVLTVDAPAAGTFTADASTDVMSKSAHGFKTGLKVQVSNSGGALPSGLSAATDYFVIYVAAGTFKLATSSANAIAGTAIDITTNGTGTQTVTPTAIAGASMKLQGSQDNSNWFDLGVSSNITATANILLEKVDPSLRYIRAYYTMTAGQVSFTQYTIVKG